MVNRQPKGSKIIKVKVSQHKNNIVPPPKVNFILVLGNKQYPAQNNERCVGAFWLHLQPRTYQSSAVCDTKWTIND